MKYCRKLFNEINFEPHALSPCCNTQGIVIPQFKYEGGVIDLEAYGKYIETVFAGLQAGDVVCRNCVELREIDVFPGMTGKFSAISINMHRYFCNCKCVYCGLWSQESKGKGYEVLPGLISLAEQGAISKNAFLSWGGGEPSILPAFDKTAAWAAEHDLFQYIHTNALRCSPAIASLLALDKGRINVSLDSASPDVYKRVKGVDGFNTVMATLSEYAKSGAQNIELKYIIFEENNNKHEINSFMKLAHSLGITKIHLSFNFLEQNAGKISQKSIMAAVYMASLAAEYKMVLSPFYIAPEIMELINRQKVLIQARASGNA